METSVNLRLAAMIAVAAACMVSCGHRKEPSAGQPVAVKVMKAEKKDVISGDFYVGQAEERKKSSLSFALSGQITDILVEEGDMVEKGDTLAVMDGRTVSDAYAAAAAALAQARDGHERMKKLHDAGTLPEVQWVDINTKLRQAEAAESIAAKKMEDSRLIAPYDGMIASVNCEEGEMAHSGISVFRIVDLDDIYIKIAVPENEVSGVKGAKGKVSVPAIGGGTYQGRVKIRGIDADPISHTYDVKLLVDNPGHRIIPGMLAEVFLEKDMENVISVPVNAVQVDYSGKRFVWVADTRNSVSKRYVKVSRLLDSGVEISEGLENGDMVIIDGCHKVSENMSVRIINE